MLSKLRQTNESENRAFYELIRVSLCQEINNNKTSNEDIHWNATFGEIPEDQISNIWITKKSEEKNK